ncbi:hypothetical protein L209DRAFT_582850 [Thermothelomyces heterothallicus CBS 203.75]
MHSVLCPPPGPPLGPRRATLEGGHGQSDDPPIHPSIRPFLPFQPFPASVLTCSSSSVILHSFQLSFVKVTADLSSHPTIRVKQNKDRHQCPYPRTTLSLSLLLSPLWYFLDGQTKKTEQSSKNKSIVCSQLLPSPTDGG